MATRKKAVDNDYKGIFEDTDARLTPVGKPTRANRKAAADLKKMLAGEKKPPAKKPPAKPTRRKTTKK